MISQHGHSSRFTGRLHFIGLISFAWWIVGISGCQEKQAESTQTSQTIESSDVVPANPKSVNPKSANPKSANPKPVDPQPAEPKPADPVRSGSESRPPRPESPSMQSAAEVQRAVGKSGSADRDGDVSLEELAESLRAVVERTDRESSGDEAQTALTDAIAARQSIPSPAQVVAMGQAKGTNGEALAADIEAMRIQLDRILERLDREGAGVISPAALRSSVMSQNVVIE
ncbi:hypothetical protein [Neorhodopirellula pilleata]|uniref:EF-hand domain-containing protein n=1 Tax=Neorhodopirellula pilleata TaxID=2714738 RepID=A0A5C5ZKZ6_9BACT|nr:hypothetical protein [Neorhodopirellula pilleata]TWT87845.1 hypothetical protein Pla100_58840 [Neorhodopirellula pilleata]